MPPGRDGDERLAASAIWIYALPAMPMGFMFVLVGFYLLKYSTDVLGIAPAAIGTLFFVSRLWDAFSDPLCGFLTDRTRTRFGRRRPWLLLGALPLALSFGMLWSPPAALDGGALVVWMGSALILFYTSLTIIEVPHSSLGAELSDHYHERTHIFGVRRALFGIGALLAVLALGAFELFTDARAIGRGVALAGGAIALAAILATGISVRERAEYQRRRTVRPFEAARDVWRNPHARLLLVVSLIQQLGIVALTAAMPFLSDYVFGTPQYTAGYVAAFFVASLAGVPLWLRIAPRFEKKQTLMASMLIVAAIIALLYFAGEGDVAFVFAIAILGGLAGAGADVIGPSIQADVIDWDELQTGQRKEGIYFASWAFAAKTAGGLASAAIGWTLAALGFVPNAPQSESVRFGLRCLGALGPALLYTFGVLLFTRFELSAAEHARIRSALDARPRV